MRPHKPSKLDKKHTDAARESMEDIKDLSGDPKPMRNDIRYMEPNRDRARADADRTGRHFDGDADLENAAEDEGTEASEDHEAD